MPAADSPPDYSNCLYVIFHGSIAFYDDPGVPWIEALVTDVKDDHVYLCGKFLGEAQIPAGSNMHLTGVTCGTDSFAAHADTFRHYTGPNGTEGASVHLDSVYSRFQFPRPKEILFFQNFHSNNPLQYPKKICIVPVFHYEFNDVTKLALRLMLCYGLSCSSGTASPSRAQNFSGWQPSASDPTPLTLHVRAEEDSQPAQPMTDFMMSNQILGNANAPDPLNWSVREPNDPVPGFSDARRFWEIELSLLRRMQWLTAVGAQIEQNAPSAGSTFTVTAPPPPADDDASCGPPTGGPG